MNEMSLKETQHPPLRPRKSWGTAQRSPSRPREKFRDLCWLTYTDSDSDITMKNFLCICVINYKPYCFINFKEQVILSKI